MQSLSQFKQDKRVDVRLAQLLHDSQILYERGLQICEHALLIELVVVPFAVFDHQQSARFDFVTQDSVCVARGGSV